jgi:hypothetical protein
MKIIRTSGYIKALKRMSVSNSDIDKLEQVIVSFPEKGDLIQGLKGVRKIRFAIGNRGKSGGGRAIYYLMIGEDAALMITAYPKNEKSDLSASDRKAILSLLKELEDE